MDQLQLAAESENGSTQGIKGANIVEGAPTAVTDADGVENGRLLGGHPHSTKVPGRTFTPGMQSRHADQIAK
ncbi:hypothetical protein D3C81_1688690 [compost metagenome]